MPCIYSLVTSSTRREKLFKWLSRVIVAQLTISTLQILARLQFNVNVSYKLWYCQTTLFALNWKAIPCQWTIHWHCVKVHNIAGNVRKFKMCKIDLVTIYKRQTITFLCFVLLRKCCRYQALQTNITDIDIQYISMISQKRCWSEKNYSSLSSPNSHQHLFMLTNHISWNRKKFDVPKKLVYTLTHFPGGMQTTFTLSNHWSVTRRRHTCLSHNIIRLCSNTTEVDSMSVCCKLLSRLRFVPYTSCNKVTSWVEFIQFFTGQM